MPSRSGDQTCPARVVTYGRHEEFDCVNSEATKAHIDEAAVRYWGRRYRTGEALRLSRQGAPMSEIIEFSVLGASDELPEFGSGV